MTPARGQTNLLAFGIAVLVVTSATGLALLTADSAFAAADRDPLDRAAATGLGARLVAADSPITARANVLSETQVARLDAHLADWFPATRNASVRVTVDGEVVAHAGDPAGGATVRHVVLVANRTTRTLTPAFSGSEREVTLPRRTDAATIRIQPPPGTTVTTVRANERVELHDPAGLDGTYRVSLSRFETTRLTFTADDPLPAGSVTVTYRPATTRKAVLEVTVDV